MFDIVVFAAGRGSRMGDLTKSKAKPSFTVETETLVGRLVRQALELSDLNNVYVNCSYQELSVIQALNENIFNGRVSFLWEKQPMGTAWSLIKVHEHSGMDILAIHGDLYIESMGLIEFQDSSKSLEHLSVLAAHRRPCVGARSRIVFDPESLKIESFSESPACSHGNFDSCKEEVWSNSGIYFFRSAHLRSLKSDDFRSEPITMNLLNYFVSRRMIAMLEFKGKRFAIENPTHLESLRKLKTQIN